MFRISARALASITPVLLVGSVASASTIFNFSITDQYAGDNHDRGSGWLEGDPSGLGDGSFWITSGQITFTETDDAVSEGTWNLITSNGSALIGPLETLSEQGEYAADNLFYPGQNANLAGTSGIYGDQASYLTEWGLLFGNETHGADFTEINIWGNGGGPNNYSFNSLDDNTTDPKHNADADETFIYGGETVPEPASLSILCLSSLGLFARRRRHA